MKSFAQIFLRRFSVLVLALTLVMLLAGNHVPTSYAATHSQARIHSTSLHAIPALNGWNSYVRLYTITQSGRNVSYEADWGNSSGVQEVTFIYYGDGGSDSYYCEVNCVSGRTTFAHTFPRNGTYHLTIQLWWYYPAVFGGIPVEQATNTYTTII